MGTLDIVISLVARIVALAVVAFTFRRLVPHFDDGNHRATWPLAFVVAGAVIVSGFVASLFNVGVLAGAAIQLTAAGVAGKLAFRISVALSIAIAIIAELSFAATMLGIGIVAPLVITSPVLAAVGAAVVVGFVAIVTRSPRIDPSELVGD